MEARIDPWFAGSAESIQGEWAVCRGISTSDLDAILTEQYAFYDA
jgi:hypothetical protein